MFNVKNDPIAWNQFKDKIQMRWDKVNDSELNKTDGDIKKIVAIIQLRSGHDPLKIANELQMFLGENSDDHPLHQEGVGREYNRSVTDTIPNFKNSIDERYL